jgi:esterase/lipase/1-acyl-sn-glycerol-3-phosphate acyltransferase
MNRFAYRTTSLALKTLSNFIKARLRLHGQHHIPRGAIIFVVNHFTRLETLLMPNTMFKLTGTPVWSLASFSFFKGSLGTFLDSVGVVSTRNPHRDLLIVKTLLTGEANWIIFPEGRMVKNKKIIEKGRYIVSYAGGQHPPHTGAASLALRTEFYRQRLKAMFEADPVESRRLMDNFRLDSLDPVLSQSTYIVPVNITYYPLRAQENILSELATYLMGEHRERLIEELMTEGTMLFSGVDIDVRFGRPINVQPFLSKKVIQRDIHARTPINFDDPIASKPTMRKVALNIMQQYMSEIYSMTTVNLDHLIASMLKMSPSRKIKIEDLKKRVFLASMCESRVPGVHFHESIGCNPINILSDGNHHELNDFLSLTVEKKILLKEDAYLFKNKSKFATAFEFHRVRIDNPIAVIANEVEPLVKLQTRLRRLSWQPGFWLRRKIAKHLINKAEQEYENDYRAFFREGDSKTIEVGRPLLIKGRSRSIGVVLIHGYMAAPPEVKQLAHYLGRQGIWVYVPRLKGHGTSPEDLAIRRYPEWVASVQTAYAVVSNICDRVVAGGISTGAGLALDLALKMPDIAGVFAACPPMRLQDFSAKLVPAVDAWNKLMDLVHLENKKKEFVDNHPENRDINYFRNPISGVRELERFMDSLEPRLPDIKTPALVVQSVGDPVVNPRGSRLLFKKLGAENKTYVLFNFNRHGIFLGEGADKVHRMIGDFIKGL